MYNDYLDTRDKCLAHYGIPGMKWRFTKYASKIRKGGKDVYEYVRKTGNSTINSMKMHGRIGQAIGGVRNAYNNATGGTGIQGTVNRKLNQMRLKTGSAIAKGYGRKALKFAKGIGMGAKRIVNNVLRNLRNRRAVNQTADTLEQLRKKHTVSGRAQAYKEYSDKLAAYNKVYGTGTRPKNYNQRMFQESGGYNPLNRKKFVSKTKKAMLGAVPKQTKRPKNYNQRMFQESGGYNPLNRKNKNKGIKKTKNPYWGRK